MTKILMVLGAIALTVILSALLAFPVMWLWNGVMPDLFNFRKIDWQQAWMLQLLCYTLFGHKSSTKSND